MIKRVNWNVFKNFGDLKSKLGRRIKKEKGKRKEKEHRVPTQEELGERLKHASINEGIIVNE